MKQIDVSLWEISLAEVLKLSEDMQILIYETLMEKYCLFRAGHIPLSFLTSVSKVFFTFEEPKFKDKETN